VKTYNLTQKYISKLCSENGQFIASLFYYISEVCHVCCDNMLRLTELEKKSYTSVSRQHYIYCCHIESLSLWKTSDNDIFGPTVSPKGYVYSK